MGGDETALPDVLQVTIEVARKAQPHSSVVVGEEALRLPARSLQQLGVSYYSVKFLIPCSCIACLPEGSSPFLFGGEEPLKEEEALAHVDSIHTMVGWPAWSVVKEEQPATSQRKRSRYGRCKFKPHTCTYTDLEVVCLLIHPVPPPVHEIK